ncbi:AI-2E family transporter [Isoptericola sp. b441]|uniref:AI-2E family transporter n=1 Tax=Actinotalea lenta TaxID=3064654 RepID=A0ABT9DCD0_9CELL|nr:MULTISPECIES: AI-2E family transporter [unclassified Isoptericola]MDO8106843.1 AI-2E family transporter [Isoptericola sp. b441]MDO8121446.1 AI-2E family transporter [Isoptericola sp. b490]
MSESTAQGVPDSIRLAAAWAWRVLLIALLVVALVALMGVGKVIWVPVVIALLLTVLLQPLVTWLVEHARMWRGAAAAVAVLGLIAVVAGLLTLAGRQIATGVSDLWNQASQGFDELITSLSSGPLGLDQQTVQHYVTQIGDQLRSNSGSLVSGALSATVTAAHVGAGALITLFCTLFFLKDGPLIWTWLVRLVPPAARERVHEAGRRGVITLGAFTRTQILVALIDAIGIGLGALFLGLPLVVPLAVLVFLASFVPFVGAIATGAIAVLVALVDKGPVQALIMLGVVLLVQQIEGHVLQPLLLGHAVSVHPVAVLLSVTAGSLASGVVGALLAVPFVATLNTVVLYLKGHDKFPQLGSDAEGLRLRLDSLNATGSMDQVAEAEEQG